MKPTNPSTANKYAALGLGLCIVALSVYVSIIERVSFPLFAAATAGALCAGIVALALSLRARGGSQPLARVSIAVALGYLLALGIVSLNLVVAWVLR